MREAVFKWSKVGSLFADHALSTSAGGSKGYPSKPSLSFFVKGLLAVVQVVDAGGLDCLKLIATTKVMTMSEFREVIGFEGHYVVSDDGVRTTHHVHTLSSKPLSAHVRRVWRGRHWTATPPTTACTSCAGSTSRSRASACGLTATSVRIPTSDQASSTAVLLRPHEHHDIQVTIACRCRAMSSMSKESFFLGNKSG